LSGGTIGRRLELEAKNGYGAEMAFDVPLQEMTLHSKLELLEALWDDLSRTPDALSSPEWHREILDEHRQRLESGEERVISWEAAKLEIRQRLT
jgi:hypothetical protein